MPDFHAQRAVLLALALVIVAVFGTFGAGALTAERNYDALMMFTLSPSSLPPELRFTPSHTLPPHLRFTPSHTLTPSRTFTPSPTAFGTHTITQTAGTPVASPTHSVTPSYPQCAWAWARQPLEDITQQVQTLFIEQEFSASVYVEAYGENCIDYRGGTPSVAYFAAMTTDFYLNIYAISLSNPDNLAATYLQAYTILLDFVEEAELPARPGYLTMTFNAPDYMATVRALFDEIEDALDDDLTGQALLEALGGWPLTPFPQPT